MKSYNKEIIGCIAIFTFLIFIRIQKLQNTFEHQSTEPSKSTESSKLQKLWGKRVEKRNSFITENNVRDWGTDNGLGRVWDIFFPDWHCPYAERLGRAGDGGKWVCNYEEFITTKDCVVYSLGLFNNDEFERSIHEAAPQCDIHSYDPTKRVMTEFHMDEVLDAYGAHFHHVGITGNGNPINIEGDDVPTMTLKQAMEKNDHTQLSILKVDIEFSEWDLFDQMLCDLNEPSCQPLPTDLVLLELHFRSAAEVVSLFEKMAQHGFGIFEMEPNPIAYPLATEYAFVRVKKV